MEENQFCLVWANRIISTIYLWGEFSRSFLGQGYYNIVSFTQSLTYLQIHLIFNDICHSFLISISCITIINSGDELVEASTKKTLGTQSTAEHFDEDPNHKHYSFLEVDVEHGVEIVTDCSHDRRVHLTRVFKHGRQMDYALCPLQEGYNAMYDFYDNPDLPSAEIATSRGNIIIEPNEDGTFYSITGDGATSDKGYPCDEDVDCDKGLVCNTEDNLCALLESGGL